MEKWLYIVHTNCKYPERVDEFNEWYDKIHIPDILAGSPDFIRAMRFEKRSPAEGEGKYIAIYEIESEDIDQTIVAHRDNMINRKEQGRMSNLVSIVSRNLYKQVDINLEFFKEYEFR